MRKKNSNRPFIFSKLAQFISKPSPTKTVKEIQNVQIFYIVSSHISEIQVQHVGDAVKFNCSAGGLPLPKVTLFKDVRLIFPRTVDDGNGLIKPEMVIHRFKPSDSGYV